MSAQEVALDTGFWLATTPATVLQRRVTLAAMVVLFLLFMLSVRFAHVVIAQSDGFVPFIQAMMFVTELATAVLLYTQFAALRTRAILLLASGYLFTSLVIVAHTLVFPRALLPEGSLGAGPQTVAWLYVIWHFVFPASVVGYALLKDQTMPTGSLVLSPIQPAILRSIAIVSGSVFALTWLLIAASAYLPPLLLDRTTFASLAGQTSAFDTLVCVLAFVLLWKRQHSFLGRWLLLAVFAMGLEVAILAMMTGRFTVGWYAGRLFGVIASTVVLIALLTETMMLYARLAGAVVLARHERTRQLMSLDTATSAIAHELRQPLTSITVAGTAALNWLEKTPPDLEEARACLASIVNSGHHADDVISAVRELFKARHDHRTMIRIDDVALQALSIVKQDLESRRIVVETEFPDGLPEILADRRQMQQVILNLIRNAIDAMNARSPDARRLKISTMDYQGAFIVLLVEDSGTGIQLEAAHRVFDPYFTTKSAGMGLGLAICRTIVEDHGGTLRLVKTDADGSTFEIALPIAATDANGARMPQ